jgi:phage nucleotide-binding protein
MTDKLDIIDAGSLDADKTMNVLIYGSPGVGKTYFGSTAPNPLIISVESGDMTINDPEIKAKISRNCNTVQKVALSLKYAIENNFDTVVLDSLTRYCEIFLEDHVASTGKQKLDWESFGVLKKHIDELVWKLQGKNINSIFICHEKDSEESTGIVKRPALPGKLVQSVTGIVDVVAYLQSDAKGERLLSVSANPMWYAKHRVPPKYRITEMLKSDFGLLYDRVINYKSHKKEK